MFRGKKEKKSHVALGLVELKGDDVTMTELEKKNTILSDGFFPPPPLLRAGSLVFVSRLFVQVAPRHVGIVLPPVETYPIDAAATTTVFLFFGVSCSV